MSPIYHVTTAAEWELTQQKGYYEAPSLQAEGFIHCSKEEQVGPVLERYFADKTGLVKLVIDPAKLTHELKFEFSPSVNEEFPHVFGVINIDAVIQVQDIGQ